MKRFVIAGDRRQADIWIKSNLEKRRASGETTLSWSDYVVVSNPDRIMGVRDPHGVFIGTWKERKDIVEIVERLMLQSVHVNTALGSIYKQIKPTKLSGKSATHIYIDEAASLMAQDIDNEVIKSLMKTST